MNISSLYQYFSNKEALVHELQRRFIAKVHESSIDGMTAARPRLDAMTLPELIRVGVTSALAAVAQNPELQRAFLEELPRSVRHIEPLDPGVVRAWQERVMPLMVGVPDPAIAFFLWGAVMDGVVRAGCSKPELLNDPRFADEIVVLLERFLIRRPPS